MKKRVRRVSSASELVPLPPINLSFKMPHDQTLFTRRSMLALATLGPLAVNAQPVNDGSPLRIVVPFAPGSTIDAIARLVATKLPDVSAQKVVVVDNRPGAAGILGTSIVAKAKPDGKTLLLQANGLSTAPSVRHDLPYDVVRDLAPICFVGIAPYALIGPANSPYANLKDLFEATAQNSGFSYGTTGPGSQEEFVVAQLSRLMKLNYLKVPFKGQADTLLAVMGDQIQLATINLPSVLKQGGNRVKIYATLTEQRYPGTPTVPTLAEAGFPGIEESAWYGFLTPAGTPPQLSQQLTNDVMAVLGLPEVRAQLSQLGLMLQPAPPSKFAERMNKEIAHYTQLAKEHGIRAE